MNLLFMLCFNAACIINKQRPQNIISGLLFQPKQYLHPTGNEFIDDTANVIIDETVQAANSFVQAAVENVQAAVVNVERAIDGVQKIEQEDEIKYESFVENDEIVKAHFQIYARF